MDIQHMFSIVILIVSRTGMLVESFSASIDAVIYF